MAGQILIAHDDQAQDDPSSSHARVADHEACVHDARYRALRDSAHAFPLGIAKEPRPPVKPNRLRCRSEVLSCDCELRVSPRVNDPLRGRPELIDCFVTRVRIQELLAEDAPGQLRRAVPDRNRRLQALSVGPADADLPSRPLIAGRVRDHAAAYITHTLTDAERIKQASRFRRAGLLLLLWRRPVPEPLMILSALVHPMIVGDHSEPLSLRNIFLYLGRMVKASRFRVSRSFKPIARNGYDVPAAIVPQPRIRRETLSHRRAHMNLTGQLTGNQCGHDLPLASAAR